MGKRGSNDNFERLDTHTFTFELLAFVIQVSIIVNIGGQQLIDL